MLSFRKRRMETELVYQAVLENKQNKNNLGVLIKTNGLVFPTHYCVGSKCNYQHPIVIQIILLCLIQSSGPNEITRFLCTKCPGQGIG